MTYTRYAIYYLPPAGALSEFGATWLGWDIREGRETSRMPLPGIAEITERPCRYGFHATLKPPFGLATGRDADALAEAVAHLARRVAPAGCDGLELGVMGRFLALIPMGDASGLGRIAAACVEGLDAFRAPPSEAELARRSLGRLSERQEALLKTWGSTHVMERFRFHMTLSGPLPKDEVTSWAGTLRGMLPPLPRPFALEEIALCGERPDGRFELIARHALTG